MGVVLVVVGVVVVVGALLELGWWHFPFDAMQRTQHLLDVVGDHVSEHHQHALAEHCREDQNCARCRAGLGWSKVRKVSKVQKVSMKNF